MSGLNWWNANTSGSVKVATTPDTGQWVGDALCSGRATLSHRLTNAGFEGKCYPTQAEAQEYIENCYALWVASGGEV